MILKEFPASMATRGVVRSYRIAHFSLGSTGAQPVKLYTPKAEHSLQFFVRGEERVAYADGRCLQYRGAITGSHDEITRRTVSREFMMLQISFEPDGLHRLTGLPCGEIHNRYLSADELLGPGVLEVWERLAEASGTAEQLAIADAYIARLAARERERDPRPIGGLLRTLRDEPSASISELAAAGGRSVRQFERLCAERTGVGPKTMQRLARFDRAFNARLQDPRRDWLQIALDCGYHDYQHMARDFSEFAACTPPKLLQAHASAPECRLGLRQEFDLSYPGPGGMR